MFKLKYPQDAKERAPNCWCPPLENCGSQNHRVQRYAWSAARQRQHQYISNPI